MEPRDGRAAAIAGASGLVGGYCLRALLDSPRYARTISLGRRIQGITHPKLVERIVNLTSLDPASAPPGLTDAFCCLGTTIRKAGSQEAFRAIDHDAVLSFARWARAGGARSFVLVSSMSANPRSRIFYSRIKGETERDLASAGFESLLVLRPSLIAGPRNEQRIGERIGLALAAALRPVLPRNLRAIQAETIGKAMVAAAAGQRGNRVFLSGQIPPLVDGTT